VSSAQARSKLVVIGVGLRFLLRKIRRGVFFLDADSGPGLYIDIRLRGLAIFLIGQTPQFVCDGILIVFERKDSGADGGTAFVAVAVVESRSSDAHGYVGGALANMSGTDQATLAADDIGHALVVDGLAQKIGRWIQLSKAGLGALQLLLHGGEQDVALFVCGQDCPGLRYDRQNDAQYPSAEVTTRFFLHLGSRL
jgi:hypothetical protein